MQKMEIGNTENDFALDLPAEMAQSIIEGTTNEATSPTIDEIIESNNLLAEE